MLKISLRFYLAFFLLLGVVFSVIYYQLAIPTTSLPTSHAPILEESMHGIQVKRFNQQGDLSQIVKIKSWLHYKGETATQMLSPYLETYHRDGHRWIISANHGQGFQGGMKQLDKVQLSQNVIVQRLGQTIDSWLTLKTENLLLFPKQPSAITEDHVLLNGPGITLNALGMRAHLDQNAVEFLKEVKCCYVKPTSTKNPAAL